MKSKTLKSQSAKALANVSLKIGKMSADYSGSVVKTKI